MTKRVSLKFPADSPKKAERFVKEYLLDALHRSEMVDRIGAERTKLLARNSQLSAEMAKLAYEAFDELGIFPHPVETYPEDEDEGGAAPFGWCSVLHTVTVQLNYSFEEEIDAYFYGIEHALRNFAEPVFSATVLRDARLLEGDER